jgi:hypothetical protein
MDGTAEHARLAQRDRQRDCYPPAVTDSVEVNDLRSLTAACGDAHLSLFCSSSIRQHRLDHTDGNRMLRPQPVVHDVTLAKNVAHRYGVWCMSWRTKFSAAPRGREIHPTSATLPASLRLDGDAMQHPTDVFHTYGYSVSSSVRAVKNNGTLCIHRLRLAHAPHSLHAYASDR